MERASRVVLVLGGVLAWGAGIAYAFWSVAYFCLRDFERGPFWWVCALTLGAYNIYKCAQAGGFLHIPVGISYASRKVFRGSFLAKLRRTLFLFRKARQSWSPLFWLWMPHGILVVALLAIGPWIGLPLVMGLVINIGVRLIVFVVVVFRPPGVLYLGPSSDLNFNLLRLLRTDLLEVRIVHLLSPAAAASSDARWERYNGALDNWRTDDPYLWMEIVRGLMDDLAPLVVVDVRTLTRHVLLELEACVRATKVVKKMLVVTESGESPLLDRFQESVQTTPWPEAPVHLINEGHEFLFDIQQFLVRPNLNQDLQKTRPSDLVSEIRKVLSLPRVVW